MNHTPAQTALRLSRPELEKALIEAGAVIKNRVVKCPFHDDQNPSGSLYQDQKQVWRFKCHGCEFNADIFEVRARHSGKLVDDVLKESRGEIGLPEPAKRTVYPTLEKLVASYEFLGKVHPPYLYTNPKTGLPDLVVTRIDQENGKKTFQQARPQGSGFVKEGLKGKWPLFNRKRLSHASTAIVVEGEKCVQALTIAGFVATTGPGGAGKSDRVDWTPLAGKTVFLWPDADPLDDKGNRTGIDHMRQVAEHLATLDPMPSVAFIDPDELDLPPKGDVYDYLKPYGKDRAEMRRAVEGVLSLASALGPSDSLDRLIEDTISGKRESIALPWSGISRMTQALLPGTVVCICGDPGTTKSFLILDAASHWHENQIKYALLMMEDEREEHLLRVLAQIEGNGEFTDAKWVKTHADVIRDAMSRNRALLDQIAARIHIPAKEDVSLPEVLEWIKAQCEAGCRVIVVDPVTAADSGGKPWIADREFIMGAKAAVRRAGASLILNTHPRMGQGKPGLAGMAGGAAYPRFSHTVLWIHRHDPPKKVTVNGMFGTQKTTINRSIKIAKARNGRGAGLEIGFDFLPDTLRFAERGIVMKTHRGEEDMEAE